MARSSHKVSGREMPTRLSTADMRAGEWLMYVSGQRREAFAALKKRKQKASVSKCGKGVE